MSQASLASEFEARGATRREAEGQSADEEVPRLHGMVPFKGSESTPGRPRIYPRSASDPLAVWIFSGQIWTLDQYHGLGSNSFAGTHLNAAVEANSKALPCRCE